MPRQELNASDARGIDVVRDHIKTFVRSLDSDNNIICLIMLIHISHKRTIILIFILILRRSSVNVGTKQSRLAWPLRKEDLRAPARAV